MAGDDTATTNEGAAVAITVLANDTDDGTLNPTTVTVGALPANGTTTVESGTGIITYTPNAGFSGTDSFTYTVADALGLVSNAATVTITVTVTGVNDPPVASDDTATTSENSLGVTINVLGNDTDLESDPCRCQAH